MVHSPQVEARIIELERLLTCHERTIEELSSEILRLNNLLERLERRLERHETQQDEALLLRPLSEEPPPPHY